MELEFLVIHMTATPEDMIVTKEMLEQWHLRDNMWSRLGYSDIIHRTGSLENLTPYNEDGVVSGDEITNGAYGFNSISRHIVLEGGYNNGIKIGTFDIGQIFTQAQVSRLLEYIKKFRYLHPDCEIVGHRDVNETTCPNFDVKDFLQQYKLY